MEKTKENDGLRIDYDKANKLSKMWISSKEINYSLVLKPLTFWTNKVLRIDWLE
mgnify:CR=1 FL=1